VRSASLRFRKNFRVVNGNRRAQAAEMVIPPGDAEGGPENRHPKCDQWLYVVDGFGLAIVNRKRRRLSPNTLLLIGRGEPHEIRNTGPKPLRTLNIYVPPAF
jgi:mannose-6-phosphate isomerase-like protein (cupin superfamily)